MYWWPLVPLGVILHIMWILEIENGRDEVGMYICDRGMCELGRIFNIFYTSRWAKTNPSPLWSSSTPVFVLFFF